MISLFVKQTLSICASFKANVIQWLMRSAIALLLSLLCYSFDIKRYLRGLYFPFYQIKKKILALLMSLQQAEQLPLISSRSSNVSDSVSAFMRTYNDG
ncbi:hypothetical protein AB4K20DRAFT_1917339 [Rhizopus microsporus]